MKRIVSLVATLLALALLGSIVDVATAQTTSVVAASGSITMGGVPISAGTAVFVPVNSSGNPIAVTLSGGGLNLPGSPANPVGYSCTITNGAISSCLIPDENTASPTGFRYSVTITDTAQGDVAGGMSYTLNQVAGVTGVSYNLADYSGATSFPTATAFTWTLQAGNPTGGCTAPAMYTNTATGGLFQCVSGGWVLITGTGSGLVTLAGDASGTGSGTIPVTLNNVNSTPGTFGSATQIPQCTYNAKGLVTSCLDVTATGGASGTQGSVQIAGPNGALSASDDTTVINALAVQEYTNTAHAPLAYWDAALHNCKNQAVNVVIQGDSRSIVDTTVSSNTSGVAVTFAQRWANQLANYLQSVCGSHGSGLVPFRWGTGTFSSQGLNADDYTVNSQSDFAATDTALGPYQPNTGDPMVVTAVVSGATITFAPQLPSGGAMAYDHLQMYCINGPGLNTWTINIDGAAVGTCGGSGDSTETAVLGVSSAVSLATHAATIVCATEPCEGYGVEAIAGTTGVSVHNLSIGGASAEAFWEYPSTQLAFSNLIAPQALDIVYHVTNEPGQNESTTQFQASLNNMVAADRAQAYPPSILIFSPMLDDDNSSAQAPFYPILLSTAQANNTAYADLRGRWGSGVAPSWLFGSDYTHENGMGNGEVFASIAQTILDVPSASSSGGSGGGCTSNCTINGGLTVLGGATGNVSDSVSTSAPGAAAIHVLSANGTDPSAQYQWRVAGVNLFDYGFWGTGDGSGLAGAGGLFDESTSHFVWSTNASDDLFGYTPVSNVAAGTNAAWTILHTGAASFSSVSAPVVSVAHPTSLSSGTMSVANGSTTTVSFTSGFPQTDARFAITVVVNSTTTSGSVLTAVNFAAPWQLAGTDTNPVCITQASNSVASGVPLYFSYATGTAFGIWLGGSASLAPGTYQWVVSCGL